MTSDHIEAQHVDGIMSAVRTASLRPGYAGAGLLRRRNSYGVLATGGFVRTGFAAACAGRPVLLTRSPNSNDHGSSGSSSSSGGGDDGGLGAGRSTRGVHASSISARNRGAPI